MRSERLISTATDCAELEEVTEDRAITRLSLGLIEITGLEEGGLNLARMSRAKYFALVLILVLAASLSLS